MKETVKSFVIIILVLSVVLLSITSMKCYQKSREKPETKTIVVSDTITKVVYDTLFIDHFETVKLPITDTIVIDSLRIDSVFVEVPISIYKFDTCFTTDSTNLNIMIRNSGFNVILDSLSYSFTYRPTKINKTKKIHWFIGPSIGLGYDFTTGKFIPTIGIGLIIKRF